MNDSTGNHVPLLPDVAVDGGIRVAFGSCNRQSLPQTFWEVIEKQHPQSFLWTGDAVYADVKGTDALDQALRNLSENPYYLTFVQGLEKRKTSIQRTQDCSAGMCSDYETVYGIYDDHDLGVNDGGRDIPDRAARRELFQRFLAGREDTSVCTNMTNATESESELKRGRESYRTFALGAADGSHSVRVVILDTRYHRDPHAVSSVGSSTHWIYPFLPLSAIFAAAVRGISASFFDIYNLGTGRVDDHLGGIFTGDILGDEQWRWLNNTLAEPSAADFTVIVSSVQVFTSNPIVESWGHFPRAKTRLFNLLQQHRPPGLVFLSGDVHHAELSRATQQQLRLAHEGAPFVTEGFEREIVEITSSGLTHTCSDSLLTRYICPLMLKYAYNYGPVDRNSTDASSGHSGHRLTPDSFHIGRNFGILSTRHCNDTDLNAGGEGRGAFCLDVEVFSIETNEPVLRHTVVRDWRRLGETEMLKVGLSSRDSVSSSRSAVTGNLGSHVIYTDFPLWSTQQLQVLCVLGTSVVLLVCVSLIHVWRRSKAVCTV